CHGYYYSRYPRAEYFEFW
nr:immunoglobulin heavy chain junction region [Macaca mulatta]MOX94370.1 immunoglobulin heavy chain junction region [Macaca mulatta]MOX97131.1 immunoglobulin heavy chain junction region [Macaca mulatta]